jgi:hypothetical protein
MQIDRNYSVRLVTGRKPPFAKEGPATHAQGDRHIVRKDVGGDDVCHIVVVHVGEKHTARARPDWVPILLIESAVAVSENNRHIRAPVVRRHKVQQTDSARP